MNILGKTFNLKYQTKKIHIYSEITSTAFSKLCLFLTNFFLNILAEHIVSESVCKWMVWSSWQVIETFRLAL